MSENDEGVLTNEELANMFGSIDRTEISAKELHGLTAKYPKVPPQFISDLYHIVKCRGEHVLTDDKVEERAIKESGGSDDYWSYRTKWNKQKLFFTEFSEHPLLEDAYKKGAWKGTLDLLKYFEESAQKFRDTFDKIEGLFGGDSDNFTSPSEKWTFKDVNKWKGSLDSFTEDPVNYDNILGWGMHLFNMAAEDLGEAQDDETKYTGDKSGTGDKVPYFRKMARTGNLTNEIIRLGNLVEKQDLAIYGLSTAIKGNLDIESDAEELKKTDVPDDSVVGSLEDIEEINRVLPFEHAQDDDIFDYKLITNDLNIEEYQKPEKVQNLFYVLVDVSYSMNTFLTPYNVTCYGFTNAITLSLLERIHDNKTKIFYREFEGSVGPLKKALEPNDIKPLRDYILNSGPNGTTDTWCAIKQAIEDIAEARAGNMPEMPNLDKAEILIMSDACDSVPVEEILELKKKHNIKINYVLCDSDSDTQDQFQAISDKFLQLDGNKKLSEVLRVVKE